MTNLIVSGVISVIIIPCFAPMLIDFLTNMYIQIMNKAKGKPTWVTGTMFKDVILPNGARIGECYITAVTWKIVVLKAVNHSYPEYPGCIRIRKRRLMKCDIIEVNNTIIK